MSSAAVDQPSAEPAFGAAARRALIGAASGSFLEWYDFYLFGTTAALVFGTVFFPESSPTAGTINSFGTFAAGFVTRPIGAVIFGHFGDRLGRRRMLLITVSIMGGGTFLTGCIPSYNTIGAFAPALLIALRLAQGIGIGGEFGGGSLLAIENAPIGRRGLAGSIHQIGTPLGLLASTGIVALVELLPDSEVTGWAWRIPFLLGGVFLIVALFIRRRVEETPVFERDSRPPDRVPFVAMLRDRPKSIALAIGARLSDAVTFNVINVFGISYATMTLGVDKQVMLTGFVIGSAVEVFVVPLVGQLSDRVGRRPLYATGAAICGLVVLAYFPLLDSGSTVLAFLIIVIMLAFGTGLMFAIEGVFFSEMFDTHTRYTGVGSAYQVSALIGGAPAPAIAAGLAGAFAHSYWPPALYVTFASAITFACVLASRETFRDRQTETDP